MSSANKHVTETARIPQLQDPNHPGMQLVSKIALFSLSLFLLLFALVALAGNRVMLNFELDATARYSGQQLQVVIDEQKAAVLEPGTQVALNFDSGAPILATISQLGSPVKGRISMVVWTENEDLDPLSEGSNAQDISLKVQQSLKEFMLSKLFP